jgi:hypothetical protein
MSQMKGFKIERSPQKSAARWVDLLRSGKRDQAAAQVAEESCTEMQVKPSFGFDQ